MRRNVRFMIQSKRKGRCKERRLIRKEKSGRKKEKSNGGKWKRGGTITI
jgi:hypothetical protein